jgi:hypothetical protein
LMTSFRGGLTLYLKQYVRMSVRDGVWQAD